MRSSTTPGTLYSVLGLEFGAPISDVKSAYRKLVRVSHPDVGGDRSAFEALTQVYEYLCDPNRKAVYDATFRPSTDLNTDTDHIGGECDGDESDCFDDPTPARDFPNSAGSQDSGRMSAEQLRMQIYRLEDLTAHLRKTLRQWEQAEQRRIRPVWWRRWPALTAALLFLGLAVVPQIISSLSLSAIGTDYEWLKYSYYLGHVIFYATIAAIVAFTVSRVAREIRSVWVRRRIRRAHLKEMS